MASYTNATGTRMYEFHTVVLEAIANGGVFPEEYADVFQLTRNPEGSATEWRLEVVRKEEG